MGKGKAAAVIAVLIIVAGAVAAYAYANGWLNQFFKGQPGAATIAFKIKFADGSVETFETTNIYTGKLSVIPLSLYVGGKRISEIDVEIKVRLGTGGRTVKSWSSQISQRIEIYKSGQATPLTSSTGKYNPSGTSWADGETKTLLSTPLSEATIESAIRQYSGDGDFYFQAVAQITLNVEIDQGSFQLSGSGVGGLTVTMKNYEAMSLSVVVSVSPLTSP